MNYRWLTATDWKSIALWFTFMTEKCLPRTKNSTEGTNDSLLLTITIELFIYRTNTSVIAICIANM